VIAQAFSQDTKNKSLELSAQKPLLSVTDTIKKDSLKRKEGVIGGIIKYKATDLVKLNQSEKTITLYNQAEVYYQDVELKAGIIVINYAKDEVYAGRIKDTAGVYTQLPNFKQGSNEVKPDSIRFNFKTKKTLIWNSVTDQGEFKVKGEVTKKENDSVYFIRNARFTTSKDVNDPEYYFLAKKIKLVPKKKVVTGFANMYIADVPTPIGLPFAFFPMTEKRASGVIIPRYAQTNLRGFAIQNGGYYFAINDYYDLSVLGDYYTNGSYGIRTTTNYALRYKFKGNLNFRYENLLNSERGFPDYSKSTIYNLQWSHAQDSKSNTSSRFSASVNLGSSNYYQQSINQTNAANFLNNSLSSSVSYSKTFATVPQVNMSLTATHTQNTNTKEINMTLPTLQASVDRIFPFAPKNGTKKGFIKNINLQYNLRGENQFKTTDSLFFKPQMFNDAKVGLKHSIPLTTNFKVFKYFSMSAGMNYDEVWYLETIQKNYDPTQNKVVSNKVNGFDAFRQYSFSTSIGTTLYGTFNFKETGKIQSIRHVVRPSVSYAYTPSFERYYDTYLTDANGTYGDYTRFEGGMFGAPGKNLANNVGLSIGNSLEAKVKDKDETKTELKKVMLLNNLSLSTFYNVAADSLALSPVRITGGTNLFDNKVSLNFGTTLDPYAIDNGGRRINTYNIDNGGSLFRMTSSNMAVNYSLKSKSKKDEKESTENKTALRNGGREDDLFGKSVDDIEAEKKDEDEKKKEKTDFFNAKVPWDLKLAYSVTYSNNNRQDQISNSSLMFSGNIDLTPNWKVGASSGYDFVNKGFTYTQLRFGRDLKSWRMDFSWIPFSQRASWSFFIGIKSSVLSDIKWEKRTVPDRIIR
jgi:lipopolysaccharide assembly outer membrane protein LptD (OstA)